MVLSEFFNQYFILPLYSESIAYNIVNTLTYGIILAIAVFGVYKVMQKLEIKIDRNFFIALVPFIILAPVLHVIQDAGIVSTIWFISPFLYILDFFIALGALVLSIGASRLREKVEYHWVMFIIGTALVIAFATNLRLVNSTGAAQILGLTAFSGVVLYGLHKYKPELFTPINAWIMLAAMFDASSTFIAVDFYGYFEKHVLPTFLINTVGSAWIMFPLKFFVIIAALWIIDSESSDSQFNNFIKFAILTVTLGPAARNTLRLAMGV